MRFSCRLDPGNDLFEGREDAYESLRSALTDPAGPVRAAVAEAASHSRLSAQTLKVELFAALKDEDPTVRLWAARAVLNSNAEAEAEAVGPALGTLSDLLREVMPSAERKSIINQMRAHGDAGADAAVKGIVTMVTSGDPRLQSEAVECATALENKTERLVAALAPVLKANDPSIRGAAALSSAQAAGEHPETHPEIGPALTAAVIDTTLAQELREKALQALSGFSARELAACGRVLGRQLDAKEYQTRLVAATLLHMIDTHSLAGTIDPLTVPSR